MSKRRIEGHVAEPCPSIRVLDTLLAQLRGPYSGRTVMIEGKSQGMRYRADPPALLLAEPLDGLTAVFHRPSGITHLLASPAPEILDVLGREALDSDGLLARLAADYSLADADRAVLAERLAELVDAGLVRPE